jgi:hypothetical protein
MRSDGTPTGRSPSRIVFEKTCGNPLLPCSSPGMADEGLPPMTRGRRGDHTSTPEDGDIRSS